MCNSQPIRHLRSQGARFHSRTKTCHVDFVSNLSHKMVASKSRNLWLIQLLVFKERLKYTTPIYMKTQKKNTSPIKCITNKLLSLNKANIKHDFSISPFGYFVTKHTYTNSKLNVSWKPETNKELTLKTKIRTLNLEPIPETLVQDR